MVLVNDADADQASLASLDSQLLKILHDGQRDGLSEAELRVLFSPLLIHLSSLKEEGSEGTDKEGGGHGQPPTRKSWSMIFLLAVLLLLVGVIFGPSTIASGPGPNSVLLQPLVDVKSAIGAKTMVFVRILLVKLLPYWNWTDLYYSRCLVKNPFYQDNELRADDCNLCETLDEIEYVQNLSQSRALDEFIKREKPFVVIDGMNDWSIMKTNHFWFDNITELFLTPDNFYVCNLKTNLRSPTSSSTSASASTAADTRSTYDLAKIIRKLYNPHTQQWFLHWENCQKEGAKAVRQFYRRPYFISNSLDFTGSNWVLMSSDFHGRVYKKIDVSDTLSMMYQLRGSNHVRLIPKEICRGQCPELSVTLQEGEILIVTHFLWILEYIPVELGDNLAILSEVAWSSGE